MKSTKEKQSGSRVTSEGLLRYARTYRNAFFSILTHEEDRINNFYPVTFYLALHAIELGLKALLRNYGVSLDQLLYKYRHDLTESMKYISNKNIIEFSDKERELIEMLNEYYYQKQFEYILRGYKNIPDEQDLLDVTDSIIDKVSKVVDKTKNKTTMTKNVHNLVCDTKTG